jgi:peptidyl-prolyl cis-trans isomerase D
LATVWEPWSPWRVGHHNSPTSTNPSAAAWLPWGMGPVRAEAKDTMKEEFSSRRIGSLLFILVIAVVFTLQFGPGSRGCEARQDAVAASAAAVVNRKEIPAREFARAYQSRIQQFQGQGIPPELLKQLGIHRQVLDRMVETELLAQAAERRAVVASDEELRDFIYKVPLFQKDGTFSPQLYQQNVRGFLGKSVADFETGLRRELSAQKMAELVESAAAVSEDEVKARFLKEGNTANLTYVRFLPTMFAEQAPAPTPAQLAQFRKANQEAIRQHHEQNSFQYATPERARVRQILVKAPEDAPAEQKEKARAQAEKLRQQLEGGQDFATLARAQSQDPGTSGKGGELGWVERGSWVPELADAAFSLEPGQVSQPVQTRFGFHLLKLEEKKPAEARPFEQVEEEIARQLYKREQAQVLARNAAQQALQQVKAGKVLTQLYPAPQGQQAGGPRFEVESKPEARESGSFNASVEAVPGLGPAPELLKDVFAADSPTVLPEPYKVGEGFVVASVTERSKPSESDFQTRREALQTDARRAKQYELRDTFVKELKKQGSVVINEEVLAEVAGS